MKNVGIEKLIIKRLLIELKKRDKSGIYGYTQIKMASNLIIKQNKLSQKQITSIFEYGVIYNEMNQNDYFIVKDIEENTAYFKMFIYVLKNINVPLTIDFIKNMYSFFVESIYEYSLCDNKIEDSKKFEQLQYLIDLYSNKTLKIEDIALFNAIFQELKPLNSCNDQISKMIVFKQCLENDLIPLIIQDKVKYLQCLNLAQSRKEYKPLISYFKNEQENYLNTVKEFVVDYEDLKNSNKF